jgi:hypothetical protein
MIQQGQLDFSGDPSPTTHIDPNNVPADGSDKSPT